MGVLKGVLKEEFQNSLRLKKSYERELARLPKGVLVKKKIKGHEYYYLLLRENGKVRFIYKGKISQDEVKRYRKIKGDRDKLKALLSKVKKQIKFLQKALHGKEDV
ncbi:MAG: hypothetical protein JW734_05420 [Candidatus Omnitrophica bacterium]|nr:hypothetical protein [Candidatus Omnitrophota bacterium]